MTITMGRITAAAVTRKVMTAAMMGKGIPEDVKKKLSEERLQIFIRKTGVSCLVFGLPMVGLGLVRMGIVPMSIPAIVVIVVLLAVGLVLSVKAVKYGES